MCWSLMPWLCSIAWKDIRHGHHSSSPEITNWKNVEWAYIDQNIRWPIQWRKLKRHHCEQRCHPCPILLDVPPMTWQHVNGPNLNKPSAIMHINEAQAFLSYCSCLLRTFWRKGCPYSSGGVWHRLSTHGGPLRNTLPWRVIHSFLRMSF